MADGFSLMLGAVGYPRRVFVVLIKMMNDYSKKLDENQAEIRRLFGVKDEQHSADLKGLGEGVRSNRERLDDHEQRLEDLEAS